MLRMLRRCWSGIRSWDWYNAARTCVESMDVHSTPETDAAAPPEAAEAEVSTSSNGAVGGEDFIEKFSELMQKSTEE